MKRRNTMWVALAAFAAIAVSCKPSNNAAPAEDPAAAERRRAVLSSVGDQVAGVYAQFAADARGLHAAVQAWESSAAPADREAARTAWRTAMLSWQRAEVFQIGPAAAMGTSLGGADLRDAIYSWPTRNACRVDQELVERSYADPEAFAAEAVNVRGLDAIEALLFREGVENACDPARSINADGSWAALDEAELDARRAAYAGVAAADVVAKADELVAAWGTFAVELASAGQPGAQFATTADALNALSDALFYVEGEVKDMKLAEPAGLLNCSTALCPEQREFLWSETNFGAIVANLDGFELGYTGGDGLGFDDLLQDLGQGALDEQMRAAIDAARTANAPDVTMSDALAGDPAPVIAAHAAVKDLTDLLKTQFVSVLDLELPDRAEGDND